MENTLHSSVLCFGFVLNRFLWNQIFPSFLKHELWPYIMFNVWRWLMLNITNKICAQNAILTFLFHFFFSLSLSALLPWLSHFVCRYLSLWIIFLSIVAFISVFCTPHCFFFVQCKTVDWIGFWMGNFTMLIFSRSSSLFGRLLVRYVLTHSNSHIQHSNPILSLVFFPINCFLMQLESALRSTIT